MGQEIDDVKKLQLLLKKYGRYKGKIDGWYGPKLAAAVQEFQKDNALKTDSVFGPKTRAALMAPRLDDWRSSNGTGNFNWRIIFPLEIKPESTLDSSFIWPR